MGPRANKRYLKTSSEKEEFNIGTDKPWTTKAKCISIGTNMADTLFFIEKGGSPKKGKEFCNGCPVKTPCLEYALSNPEETKYGIWGGTSERQRKDLRKLLGLEVVKEVVVEVDTITFDGDRTTWEHETLALEYGRGLDTDD